MKVRELLDIEEPLEWWALWVWLLMDQYRRIWEPDSGPEDMFVFWL